MQRPRFKRHWDDRKWQNPINSMTESATSNMFSSPFFSPLWVSLFSPVSSPVSHSCPLPPCLSPPFCPRCLLRMCLCLSFSLYLTQPLIHSQAVLLSPFFSIPSEPITLSLWTCVFSYPSISSLLSHSQSFSVVVAPLQCLKLQMIDKSP